MQKAKLKFIDSPTEQTTAVTDAVLAIVALAALLFLRQIGQQIPWKTNLWTWAFGLLAIASFLGAIAHGFKLSKTTQTMLWHLLYLSLGLLVAFFMVAAIYDVWGMTAARRVLPLMIGAGVVFFCLTLIWPRSFLVFIIYETVAMLFALGGYVWLAAGGGLAGAWLLVAGILVTMIAAGIQAGQAVSFTLIWPFDHNGTYHLMQMVGVALLVVGLRLALEG
jgi:hypothetical protein